jgi:hypothetical protein
MIGSLEEAVMISEWEFDKDEDNDWIAPEGWSYVNEGDERIVFQSPSGLIYKKTWDRPDSFVNRREYDNIQRCSDIHIPGVRVPEASLYSVDGEYIICEEMISGPEEDTYCYGKCRCNNIGGFCVEEIFIQIHNKWKIRDLGSGNIMVDTVNDVRVLIDVSR